MKHSDQIIPTLLFMLWTGISAAQTVPSPQFQLPFYSATGTATTLTGDPNIITDGNGNLSVTSVTTTQVGGVGAGSKNAEGTLPSPVAGYDIDAAASSTHRKELSNNGAAFSPYMLQNDVLLTAQEPAHIGDMTNSVGSLATTVSGLKGVPFCTGFTPTNGQALEYTTTGSPSPCYTAATVSSGIASVLLTLPITSIAANTCTTPTATTMTGVVAVSGSTAGTVFATSYGSNPNAVTGWGANGGLTLTTWPTANTLNWSVCNQTASAITPGAMTISVVGTNAISGGGGGCGSTDSFSGSGPLSTTCWTQTSASGYGTIGRVGGNAAVTAGSKGIATYTGGTYTTTQSAQVVTGLGISGPTSPVVLMQPNGTGYLWITSSATLLALNAGAGVSTFGSCPTITTGDTIKLSAVVTAGVPTITCKDVTTSASGSGTDTNLCSGSPCSITGIPGVFINGSDTLTNFVSN